MEKEQLKHLIWRVVFSVFGGLLVYGVGSGLTRAVYAVKPDEAKSMIDKVLYVSNNLGNVAWLPLTFKGKPFVGGMILLAVVALVVLYALTNKKTTALARNMAAHNGALTRIFSRMRTPKTLTTTCS